MADAERNLISVTGNQALQYIDAIEGLIFDPQPYQTPESVKPVEDKPRGRLRLPWSRPHLEIQPPTHDPVKSRLEGRWKHFTSPQIYALTKGNRKNEPEGDNREFLYEFPLYKIYARPSLLIDAGTLRTYQVDLQLLRETDGFRLVFSCLHLQQFQHSSFEANILMSGYGLMRIERDGKFPPFYTPSFIEQQRLLAVTELLSKHP